MRVLFLLPLLIVVPSAALAADLVVTDRMHHLRSKPDREWAAFPEKAEGTELVLAFGAKPNEAEHTLRLRHRDLKQSWRVVLNGTEIARLPSGPGVNAPHWPTAKPYQPMSIEFTPYVLGVSGAVFVDADGSGKFESAFEYARREVSAATDDRELVTRLGRYDGAVAVQAASLLRAQAPAAFEKKLRAMIQAAPSHVAAGLTAYLEAFALSQTGPG